MLSSSGVPSSPVTAFARGGWSARRTRHPPHAPPSSSGQAAFLQSTASSPTVSAEGSAGGSPSSDTAGRGAEGTTPTAIIAAPPPPSAAHPERLSAGAAAVAAAASRGLSTVDAREIELQSLIATANARRSLGEKSKKMVGATKEVLRLYAKSSFGVSRQIEDGVRALFSLLPAKHRKVSFETTVRRHRPDRARRPLAVEDAAAPSVHPGAADPLDAPASPAAEPCGGFDPDTEDFPIPSEPSSSGPCGAPGMSAFEILCLQATFIRLSPRFAKVKQSIMSLSGCGWREYLQIQDLRTLLEHSDGHTHANEHKDHFDCVFNGPILFFTMRVPGPDQAAARYERLIEGPLGARGRAGLRSMVGAASSPPLHIVAMGFDGRLRFESMARRRCDHDVPNHAFDAIFDRTDGSHQRVVLDCEAFFLEEPVSLPAGVAVNRHQAATTFTVPTLLRALLPAACGSIPLGPLDHDRPAPLSPGFLAAAHAHSNGTRTRDFSPLKENGWQICERLELSAVQMLRARAAAHFFTRPELLHYWTSAGILTVIGSDCNERSSPDPAKSQQLMLKVEQVRDFWNNGQFDAEWDQVSTYKAAVASCNLFGVYLPRGTFEFAVHELADWLLHVFDKMYSECLGPATFAVTADYPLRHRHRNMIFSIHDCDQHPHFEVNEEEEDRLFGVVGFNIPSHGQGVTPARVPTLVRATVVLDTHGVIDWHDGRQVSPALCKEFAPAVIREAVVHRGVSSGSLGHTRIALHQAFSSEATQYYCFAFLHKTGAHITDVESACLRQLDWSLRVDPDDINAEIEEFNRTKQPRRRIPKVARARKSPLPTAGTAPDTTKKKCARRFKR